MSNDTGSKTTVCLEAAVRLWIAAEDVAADERRSSGLYAPSQIVSSIQVAAVEARRALRKMMQARPDA